MSRLLCHAFAHYYPDLRARNTFQTPIGHSTGHRREAVAHLPCPGARSEVKDFEHALSRDHDEKFPGPVRVDPTRSDLCPD